jgi:DNA polymerase-3 subunit epsilon
MYSIIDIETTGGNIPGEKITEIAIYVYDGKTVVKSFHTLINPERSIPYNITRITGIDDRMVANAPKFYEVAKKIIEITENTIFVAHNVHFDYNFIKREFKDLGFEYNRQFVCTVKLSRQILPGHASYSLGKICNDLNIQINGRHRADGDALATVKLFEILLNKNKESILLEVQPLPNYTSLKEPKQMSGIPEVTGVYYFKNNRNELIFIGKHKNIKKSILTHLTNTSTNKAIDLRNAIHSINFEETGSELISIIKESIEIHINRPLFNKSPKKLIESFGLFTRVDSLGYIRFEINPLSIFETPLIKYANIVEAKDELYLLIEKFNLCQKLAGLNKSENGCDNYKINICNGACIQKESADSYNIRVNELINFLNPLAQNYFIIDKGRNELEKAIVHIENNQLQGIGYIATHLTADIQALKNSILPQKGHRDLIKIIKNQLIKQKIENIIYY